MGLGARRTPRKAKTLMPQPKPNFSTNVGVKRGTTPPMILLNRAPAAMADAA